MVIIFCMKQTIEWRPFPYPKNLLFREVFVKADGTLLSEGDLFVDPKLAKTFWTIAEEPMSFYNGSLAKDIADDIQEAGEWKELFARFWSKYYQKEFPRWLDMKV